MPPFHFARFDMLERGRNVCGPMSGEAPCVRRERRASRAGTRLGVGHRELLCDSSPVHVWRTCSTARSIRHEWRARKQRERTAARAKGPAHRGA